MALVVKYPPANAGDIKDAGLIPELGRSPGGGDGDPLQFSCLENPMDRGEESDMAGAAEHAHRFLLQIHRFSCLCKEHL